VTDSPLAAVRRALDRPLATTGLVASLGGSAIDNARQAMSTIAQQVADRTALTPSEAADLQPGDLGALTREDCLALMRTKQVGRLAYIARAGVPDIAPVNYVISGSDVLVRSGPGPKLQAADRRELVAFEVDDIDEQAHSGWSVVLVGRAQRLRDAELRALDEEDLPRPWAHGPRHVVVRIRPTRVTGRRLG
jgi:nitroimidazol reductase NimA-like FMN-containing flavoprotein (pyridoxamine 5'-phosphate oxidase superfamily)